jgi:cytoskeletal protein RodZ
VEDIKEKYEKYENQTDKKKKVIEEFSWCKKPKTKYSIILFVVYVIFIVLVVFLLSIFFISFFPNIKPLLFKKKTL